jgi:hypothetical protein
MKRIYKRNCPKCSKELSYSSKNGFEIAKRNESLCRGCTNRKILEKNGSMGWFKKDLSGKNNPFYGKTHTEVAKEKIRNRDKSFFKTSEYKEKVSKQVSGKGNPMYGKSVYEIWVEKYGKEKADELKKNWIEKQRINSTGSRNPMYGKPTPQGSGNGWSGWYKNYFFRSLKELSYMVNLDKENIEWRSAEHIKIKYTNWDGHERTYQPDFLVENELLIEIKPSRLQNTNIVKLKAAAAIKYSKDNNLTYKMIDPEPLPDEKIEELRNCNKIKFTDRYEKLFQVKCLKKTSPNF